MAKLPRHRMLWVTDAWDTLDYPKESTLRLMQEAILSPELSIDTYWCDARSIYFRDGKVLLQCKKLLDVHASRESKGFMFSESETKQPDFFTQIHYRTDPPVDLAYLDPLKLLVLGLDGIGARADKVIVNPPSVLCMGSEKLISKSILPPTIATSQFDLASRFGAEHGKVVLKPLHQAQSKGIELLDFTMEANLPKHYSVFETATRGFREPVLLQQFLPEITQGETRIWFLDGKILASARKIPKAGDYRIDMDRGGTLEEHALSRKEESVAKDISEVLKAHDIRLAAVDLISGFVTDFNFTSPGLLVQFEDLLGENFSKKILKALCRD